MAGQAAPTQPVIWCGAGGILAIVVDVPRVNIADGSVVLRHY
jgi:hypothetical protein